MRGERRASLFSFLNEMETRLDTARREAEARLGTAQRDSEAWLTGAQVLIKMFVEVDSNNRP